MIPAQHQFTSVWEVIQIHANKLLLILNYLDDVRHCIDENIESTYSFQDYVDEHALEQKLDALKPMLEQLGLRSAELQVDRILGRFPVPKTVVSIDTGKKIAAGLDELRLRIIDDLDSRPLLCCTFQEQRLYETWETEFPEFWLKGDADVAYDLKEAVKCMALGRYTACVFHLVRPMETATRKVAKQMEVSIEYKDNSGFLHWGVIANNIRDKLEKLRQSDQKEYEKWLRVNGMLEFVRVAWRNEVMHPRSSYGENEAREVFDAVKAFLKHLAEKV